jgi:predicted NBD/HSP70 family sugar kinase
MSINMFDRSLPNLFFLKSRQTADLRTENTVSVLYALLTHDHLSRRQIIELTGLAPSTVSAITSRLLDSGIVRRIGNRGKGTAGRKADILSRNPQAAYMASVHLTPELCRVGIVDLGYNILASKELSFPEGFSETEVSSVVRELESLLEAWSYSDRLAAIGIALPHHPYDNPYIVRSFRSAFSYPIVQMNNVEAMAMCEYYDHLSKRLHTLVFIYIGTGIGTGLIIDGNLYQGVTGSASDFGHTFITDAPIVCRCGRKGCLEAVASELSLSRAMAEHFELHSTPVRHELIDLLAANIQKGDAFTLSLLEKAASYLGRGIFNLVTILDPQEIVITGRLNRLNPFYSNLVEKAYLDHARQGRFPIIPLNFLPLREDAGLKGTVMFAFVSLFCDAENRELPWQKILEHH